MEVHPGRMAVTKMTVADLLDITLRPMAFQPKATNDPATARLVKEMGRLGPLIWRDLQGRKLRNARGPLRDYIIEEWLSEGGDGVLGSFAIGFNYELNFRNLEGGGGLIGVADLESGSKAVLVDGASRVEAFNQILNDRHHDSNVAIETQNRLLAKKIVVIVHHGSSSEALEKRFIDLNGRGIRGNPALATVAASGDRWATVASDVFKGLQLELDEKRQVSASSNAVMTVAQGRLMVIAMFHGPAAVNYGPRPAPLTRHRDESREEVDFDKLSDAADKWLRLVVGGLSDRDGRDLLRARSCVVRSVPVLLSLGALGQPFYSGTDDERLRAESCLNDPEIEWTVGPHWHGLAGTWKADKQRFVMGSAKELGYRCFKAIADPGADGYSRIRKQQPQG